jgi:tetratricopeptide (TPR) repeat protein
MNIIALSFGLTLLCLSQSAVAQVRTTDDPDSAKAAVRFQQGVDLYREGSYEGALAEFRKAYQISPSYRVLYNIAQTQYALHDFVAAYKSIIQYMAEGRGEISGDRLSQVDEMSAKLRERIAHVQVSTNLADADIRIDDVSVGNSPLPGPVPVNVGTHRVSASKAGLTTAVRTITVAGKETVRVDLTIDETSVAPTLPVAQASPRASSAPGTTITKTRSSAASSRTGLIVSLSTTAALAVATGVCAYLALGAQQDLKDQLALYPNTKDAIESARTKSKNYGHVTDILGTATIVSGGVALYFALTHAADTRAEQAERNRKSISLVPTIGGMVLQGSF